jgi:phosphoglycerate dehydrogenase-like enzyme
MEKQKGLILARFFFDRDIPETKERLEAAGENREVLITGDRAEMEKVLDRVEICMGDVPFSLYSRMPRLKWVQLWSAGADRLQSHPELVDLPFVLTSTSGIHGQQISEHIFAMLLSFNRRLPEALAAQKRHEWYRAADNQVAVLSGKTMLIAGYGAIGESVARAALAFNMKVIGLRRHPGKSLPRAGGSPEGVRIENSSKLREFLPAVDHVVNILPATADTQGLFGETEFNLMKKTALYINVGRGSTTCESALIEALKAGRIGGALLDVTEKEPLPPDSPLWDIPNVIITGHYAGMHPDYAELALETALDNLRRYVRGEPLKNRIDKKAGY